MLGIGKVARWSWNARSGRGICIRDHPEVEPYLEAVPGVLADPNVIYESAEKATTHLYYRLGAATGRFKNCYLVVVVRYDLSPARIMTMYITTEPSGSIGRILYAKR